MQKKLIAYLNRHIGFSHCKDKTIFNKSQIIF